MNCPQCKQAMERVAIAVSGVADYLIEDDTLYLESRSADVYPLAGAHLQECPSCGRPFNVRLTFNHLGRPVVCVE
jgi:hypothetical protein